MRHRSLALAVLAAALASPPAPAQRIPPPGFTAPRASRSAVEDGAELVEIAGRRFMLAVADTELTRARGLMGCPHLAADRGMLFVYPRPRRLSFWMANCLIDLDIAFLDARGRVVATYTMTADPRLDGEPTAAYERRLRSYSSRRPAQFAIELAAGTLERLGVQSGHVIDFDHRRLAASAR